MLNMLNPIYPDAFHTKSSQNSWVSNDGIKYVLSGQIFTAIVEVKKIKK